MKMARSTVLFASGLLLGAGLFLLGETKAALYLREQVDSTFFLWRAIGYATFIFQDDTTQMALALGDLPESAFRHSMRISWTLLVIGGLMFVSTFFIGKKRKAKKAR